jgi:hypothetical protein
MRGKGYGRGKGGRNDDLLTSNTMIPLIRSRRLAVPGAHEAREGLCGVQRKWLLEHYRDVSLALFPFLFLHAGEGCWWTSGVSFISRRNQKRPREVPTIPIVSSHTTNTFSPPIPHPIPFSSPHPLSLPSPLPSPPYPLPPRSNPYVPFRSILPST